MPRPIADTLADKYTEHAVGLHRVQEDVWRKVDKIIVQLHKDLAKMLKVADPLSGNAEARARVLDRRSQKMILKAYKQINALVGDDLDAVAQLESRFTAKALTEALDIALDEET